MTMNNEMVLFKLLKSPHGQANKMIQRAVSPVGGLTIYSVLVLNQNKVPSLLSILTRDEKDCEQALAADLQCDQTKINVK